MKRGWKTHTHGVLDEKDREHEETIPQAYCEAEITRKKELCARGACTEGMHTRTYRTYTRITFNVL